MLPASERRRHHRARSDGLEETLRSPGDAQALDPSISGMRVETTIELAKGGSRFGELRPGPQQ